MVDLSRFKTGARPAINPPAPEAYPAQPPGPKPIAIVPGSEEEKALEARLATFATVDSGKYASTLAEARPRPSCSVRVDPDTLSVTTIEGPGAALLEAVEEEPAPSAEQRETEPAPPPALVTLPSVEVKPARRRRARAEKQAIEAHEAEVVAPPSVADATTEALVWELRDRGYLVTLEAGAL